MISWREVPHPEPPTKIGAEFRARRAGARRGADLQLVELVCPAGRSRPASRSHRQPATATAGDCPQNAARRPDDTVGEQHAWRAADGAAGLSAHRPLLCQLARNSGAVRRRATLVPHLERGTAKISARPATDPARAPAVDLTRQLRLQTERKLLAAPGVNCRI